MKEVLNVIEQARESYLSKDGQLKVIYDAYSKYMRGVEFVPSALVASEEAREAAQQSAHSTPLTLFGMRVEIANWLKPGQWFIRPSRRG